MRHTRLVTTAIAGSLLAATALPAAAAPDGPQRLRGMEDRSFAVDVTLPDGASFPNCYTFEADGVWVDPMLPSGTWEQHRVGASTTYTATAPLGPGIAAVQQGSVSPAAGGGTLQLFATTTVPTPGGPITVTSEGEEVASCE